MAIYANQKTLLKTMATFEEAAEHISITQYCAESEWTLKDKRLAHI